MQKQLTFFELVRLLGSVALALPVFLAARMAALVVVPEENEIFGFIAYLCVGLFLPALLAVLLACLLPSWRYKTIAATLILMAIAVTVLVDMVTSLTYITNFVGSLVRLSAVLSGALVGALVWNKLKDRHTARAQTRTQSHSIAPQPSASLPKVSPFILGLSLAAIPATYLTILESTFLVVGYSAVLLLVLMTLPRIPIALLLATLLAPLAAGWASLRALWIIFFPKPPFQAAVELDLAALPQTRELVDLVCTTVGTRFPDHVILHAEPTFFVTQQKLRTFDGVAKGRTLAMGMPLLPHLTAQELMAILAHEFAHFSGRDTLYSAWVSQIYRSLRESMAQLQSIRPSPSGFTQSVMGLLLVPSLLF